MRTIAMEPKSNKPGSSDDPAAANGGVEPLVLQRIQAALEGLRFGTVTIVVQDGHVVQIERNEKVRLR